MTQRRSELLMPAGSLPKLKAAIMYGADAVYAGTPDLSLRSKSAFSLEELVEGVRFAHERGKRVYVTLNLFSHNRDIEKLPQFLETIRKVQPDGVIVADPGVFNFVKKHAPDLELHISTQANVCSSLTVDFWKDQGAALCVMARETSFDELAEIRAQCEDIKLEVFVHGAMCMTYSGRCLLSNYMAERGANQGSCAHSCRWNYKVSARLKDGTMAELPLNEHTKDFFEFVLEEEFRPGQLFPIEEDDHGSYILNSKDLCLMPVLDQYLSLGIDSLKVEGRNKSVYYVAATARAYRQAIDDYYADPESWRPEPYLKELYTLPHRGYTMGFHGGRVTELAHGYDSAKSVGGVRYGGFVRAWEGDDLILEVKNRLEAGDVLEFLPPRETEVVRLRLYEFKDAETGETSDRVSAGQGKAIRIALSAFHNEDGERLKARLPVLSVARAEAPLSEEDQLLLQDAIAAQDAERGLLPLVDYQKGRKEAFAMHARQSIRAAALTGRAPKLGLDGCCGKGCNGCSLFWHDPKYEKARKLLAQKPIGELLAAPPR